MLFVVLLLLCCVCVFFFAYVGFFGVTEIDKVCFRICPTGSTASKPLLQDVDMASKERETKFLDYTRDEFIEHILLVEAKLGRQEKRNEALFAELQRTEWTMKKEIRDLRIALRHAGGNALRRSNKKSTKTRENDKKYDTPNVAALKNEIKVLKATVSTYYDELKRLQHETDKKNIDHLIDADDVAEKDTSAAPKRKGRAKKQKKKELGTFEERMREKTNRLAKRAERRKERERIVREEKQAKQMQKIIRDKAKKKRAIEKIKAREEAAYQKRRDETMKQIHEQFERDLRLANGIKQSELALNEIENFVDKTDSRSRKQEKTERKNANEDEDIIPMADILSRLNDSSL